jgi:hypothetical protein
MTESKPGKRGFLKRNQAWLQGLAFLLLLILPYVLYLLAQSGQETGVGILLLVMTLLMAGVVAIT